MCEGRRVSCYYRRKRGGREGGFGGEDALATIGERGGVRGGGWWTLEEPFETCENMDLPFIIIMQNMTLILSLLIQSNKHQASQSKIHVKHLLSISKEILKYGSQKSLPENIQSNNNNMRILKYQDSENQNSRYVKMY